MHAAIADFITDFADQAVTLPLAIGASILLAASGWRRGALAWMAVISAVLGTMMLLKMASITCGPLLIGPEIRSPSGHTAAAAVVYGGLPAILLRPFTGRVRWALLLAALAAACIGASRLVLGVHTIGEVAVGAAVGLAGAAALSWLAGKRPEDLGLRRMLTTGALIVAILHGFRLPAEAAIQRASLRVWPFSECLGDGAALAAEPRP